MDAFSARSAAIADRLAELTAEYAEMHGRPPDRRALFLLRKRVTGRKKTAGSTSPARSKNAPGATRLTGIPAATRAS